MKMISIFIVLITYAFGSNIDIEMENIIKKYGIEKSAKMVAKEYKKELPRKIDNIVTTVNIEADGKTLHIKKLLDDNNPFLSFVMSDEDKWNKVLHYYILRDSYIACRKPMTYTLLLYNGNYEVNYFRKSDNNFLFKIVITKRDCDQFNRSKIDSNPLKRAIDDFQPKNH